METLIDAQEVSLLTAFRRLPPDAADELARLIARLAGLGPERTIDWSDSWSDEDLTDFHSVSIRRLEQSEAAEDAG